MFMDSSKIWDMLSWNAPASVGDIQSFLGLVGYYWNFIKGFSKITKPKTELLGKDKKSKWMPTYEASFQELKKRLTSAPVLVMPDMEKSFSIYCDASGQGLGCVLMQDGHMVVYASRLRKHEVHYPIHNLELAAIVHALKIWRHYLMGKRCELYTDHKSLKYIFTQSDLNLRQWTYLDLIKDFDIGMNYYPRKASMVAGALSRRSNLSQLVVENRSFKLCKEFDKLNLRIVANAEVMEIEIGTTLLQDIRRGQLEDEKI
jgi:hypothetical protein